MPTKWYLAGPFFNEPQRDLMLQIETAFLDTEVHFFSPRLASPENAPGRSLTDADAATIFKRNIDNVLDCSHMLAVLDYLLPEGVSLRPAKWDRTAFVWDCGNPVSIPDSGT